MKWGAIAGLLVVLAGCASQGMNGISSSVSVPVLNGHTGILPTTQVNVGRLYFSGKGRRPSFSTTSGVIFNELCYDDFRLTPALQSIDEYVVDDGIAISRQTVATGLSLTARLSPGQLARLGSLTVSGEFSDKQNYIIENVRVLSLTDRGREIVRENIGDPCKAAIATLEQQGRQVVLLLSAQRADKLTDTTIRVVGGEFGGATTLGGENAFVGVSAAGFGGGFENNSVAEYKLVYLSGLLNSF